ncbi:MAG: uracil-DNA glycosylase family protein [Gammaproteobacteria bacterium]|nr:uracil-DNA glycosylase family protein [Gammaproteobacteria bacterium]MDH3535554.1 uracil-DNA glycosylase family protein [Gammaproteobacteria bacterium]
MSSCDLIIRGARVIDGSGKSGDLPPRPECAARWRGPLLAQMRRLELTLVPGRYARRYHLGTGSRPLTEIVSSWRDYRPDMLPLPYPSPHNSRWLGQNPWFESEILPELKTRVRQLCKDGK